MLKKIIKNIKKTMIVSSAALMLFSPLTEATSLKDYPRVAIMNFGNKAITSKGFRDQDFAMATEYAIYQLSASGWFDLIDYEQLNTIAQMHNINNSGLVDPSTIVAMGQFAGAEYMIVGNVTGLTLKENGVNLQAKGAKAGVGEHVVNANVTVRIVDIKTGRIMGAGMGRGSSTSTNIEIGFIKDKWVERATKRYVNNDVATTVIDEVSNRTKDQKTSDEYNDEHTYDESYGNQANQNGSSEANSGTSEKENAHSDSSRQNSGSYNDHFNAGSDSRSEANANSSGEANSQREANGESYHGGSATGWDGHLTGGSHATHYNDGRHNGELIYDDATAYSNAYYDTANYNSEEKVNSNYQNDAHADSSSTSREFADANGGYDNQSSSESNASHSREYDEHRDEQYNNNQSYNENFNSKDTQSGSSSSNKNMTDNSTFNSNVTDTVKNDRTVYNYVKEQEVYAITIGTKKVSEIQVLNAISKAIRDAFYGKTGLLTVLNDGVQLKIKTGF